MRKIYLFMLMAVGLLISGNAFGAKTITVGTSGADYVDFDKARDAADAGDEIKFVTDETWTSATEGVNKGYLSKNLTINFNGKTITRTSGSNVFSTNGAQNIIFTGTEGSRVVYSPTDTYALRFYNGNNGTFTFQGNLRIDAAKPFGSLTNGMPNTVTIASGAILTITGDIVDPKTTFVNNGTLIIDGGKFDGTKAFTGNYQVKSGLFLKSIYDSCVVGHTPQGTLTGEEGDYIRVVQPIENAVAQIGIAQYATLKAALDAAVDGNKIVLLKNITEAIDMDTKARSISKAITIDFNGYTWTNSGHFKFTSNLVLKSSNGVGHYVGAHTSTIYFFAANISLTLDNVQISGGSSDDIDAQQDNSKIILKNNASLTKKIIKNSTKALTLQFDNYSYSKLWSGTGAVSVVNLGTMTLNHNPADDGVSSFTNSGTLTIDGGTYGSNMVFNGNYTIKSGLFLKSVYEGEGLESHLTEGSLSAETTVGTTAYVQVAQPIAGAVAQIGVQGYTSLDAAISAAISGQTIKLLANIDYLDKDFPTASGITFDLNGHHIYVNQGLYAEARKSVITPKDGYKWVNVPCLETTKYRFVSNDAPFVAKVGTKQYYQFNDALNDIPTATTATVKLLSNAIVLDDITIAEGKNLTWDLNGHNIDFGTKIIGIYTGSSLDIIGHGTINSSNNLIWLYSANEMFTTQTKLHIGKDVKIEQVDSYTVLCWYIKPNSSNYDGTYSYGIRVNIEGKVGKLYVQGYVKNAEDCPEFTIAETATTEGAYAAGYGKWVINGGTHNDTYEMRAGELIVNDGIFTNMSTDAIEFSKNGSGSTLNGGSCNIALSQHATKQPTIVTINGGTFSAVTPIAQANPQENEEHSAELVKCYINGGDFWSTSTGDDYDIIISQELANRIFATAGFYNEKPADKVIAKGYQAIEVTEAEYPTKYAAGYRWRIGLPGQTGTTTSTSEGGEWNEADTWNDKVVPNENLMVDIKGNVTLSGDGYAYGVTFDGGTLTIQDGSTLVIGQGGINGETIQNLHITGNGILAIAPEADVRFNASVDYVAKYAGKKEDVTNVENVDQVYWEQMTVPTLELQSFTEPEGCGDHHYYNKWDITEAWVAIPNTEVKTPFKGYFLTNFSDYSADAKTNTYNFTGVMTGSHVNPFGFNREGYTFFGNSCLAPMSIPELLMDLNTNDIQATVYLYRPIQGTYFTINMATVGRGGRPTEIDKLQGFFIFAYRKTNVAPTYQDIIWNPLLAKKSMKANPSSAPMRKMASAVMDEINTSATMTITSAAGWSDDLILFEGANFTEEFDQNFDAQKMLGDHINMYVPATQNMAVHAVADLDYTPVTIATGDEVAYTLSFSDMAGTDLELYDAETQTITPMTNGNSYSFVAQANSTIESRFFVRKERKMPTSCQTLRASQAQGVYNMMGAYMGEASIWKHLPKGVYIINGVRVAK